MASDGKVIDLAAILKARSEANDALSLSVAAQLDAWPILSDAIQQMHETLTIPEIISSLLRAVQELRSMEGDVSDD